APVMGRTNAGGTPMVPPMSGGGMGGAQGGGGGDRQRQTWLDEDEGVWGTDEGTAPGVIGR
ncbi:WXG100 family type VII secretion target, partial [Streptomyces sp. NPDC088178]